LRFRQGVFDNRPAPEPSTDTSAQGAVPAASGGSITDIIYTAAAEFGVSGDWMVSIAECESGLNPGAYNPAGYYGLFQYEQGLWAGSGYGSIYDPVAQARTTARLLSLGQSSRWPNCA
jgi:soluble lytic murein transglycosylase-like protein